MENRERPYPEGIRQIEKKRILLPNTPFFHEKGALLKQGTILAPVPNFILIFLPTSFLFFRSLYALKGLLLNINVLYAHY